MALSKALLLCTGGLLIHAAAVAQTAITIDVDETDGSPVGSARVCLLGDGTVIEEGAATPGNGQNSGRFTFQPVGEGEYRAIAGQDGFDTGWLDVTVNPDGSFDPDPAAVVLVAGPNADGYSCNNPPSEPPPVPGVLPTDPGLVVPSGEFDDVPIDLPLMISNLTVNNGVTPIEDANISLNWNIVYRFVRFNYRVTDSDDLESREWMPLPTGSVSVVSEAATLPVQMVATTGLNLSGLGGPRTVKLQLQNRQDPERVSNVLEVDVNFQQMTSHTINAGDAFVFAKELGWEFEISGAYLFINICKLRRFTGYGSGPQIAPGLYMESTRSVFGFLYVGVTGCRFTLFDGRNLNPGWTLVSMDVVAGNTGNYGGGCEAGVGGGVVVRENPARGGNALRMVVDVISDVSCDALIPTIVLRGPAGLPWTDAFN